MGSTDKTANLNLPLFVDSDKPTWRGDMNDAMQKIDDGYAGINETATNATTIANEAKALATEAEETSDAARVTADAALETADAALPRADYTDASVLNKLKNVDGAGSGLDADLFDGNDSTFYASQADLTEISEGLPTTIDGRITAAKPGILQEAYDGRFTGPNKLTIVVGSSNATPGTWVETFSEITGLDTRNFAIGGTGFTGNQNFQQQLTTAAASGDFNNADVKNVVIFSAGNDIRAKYDVTTQAAQCFQYANGTFVNARIIVIPAIWPSNPENQADQVPGGWQVDWSEVLTKTIDRLNDVAAPYPRVEVIKDAHLWLIGKGGVWKPGEVHPNETGYGIVARHMRDVIQQRDRINGTGWVKLTSYGGITLVGTQRPLSTRSASNGDLTLMEGFITAQASWTGQRALGYTAHQPPGFQVEIHCVNHNTNAVMRCSVKENGEVIVYGDVSNGHILFFSGMWSSV